MREKMQAFLLKFASGEIPLMDIRFGDIGSKYYGYAFVFKSEYVSEERVLVECWINNGIDWGRLRETSDLFFKIPQVVDIIDRLPEIYELYRASCQCSILLENINWTHRLGWMVENRVAAYCPGCGRQIPLMTNFDERESRFERIGTRI